MVILTTNFQLVSPVIPEDVRAAGAVKLTFVGIPTGATKLLLDIKSGPSINGPFDTPAAVQEDPTLPGNFIYRPQTHELRMTDWVDTGGGVRRMPIILILPAANFINIYARVDVGTFNLSDFLFERGMGIS